MLVQREELLSCLDSVSAGLSPREIIEQSSCLVFQKGRVMTYNDEVCCNGPSKLDKKITGAVKAVPLLNLLRKMVDEEIEVEQRNGDLLVHGKRSKAGLRMEHEVLLPVNQVDPPTKWVKLNEDFVDAIGLVKECAGSDNTKFALTCVHVHPKWVESCDGYQMARYKVKTGIVDKTLVRKESIQNIITLGIMEMSESAGWLHFRNSAGLTFSCRRFIEDYPDLAPFLDVTGEKTSLPKGLAEAAEKAQIFSSENPNDDLAEITLTRNKLVIKGKGPSGWYREPKRVEYSGADINFLISPTLLVELAKKHNECEVTSERLKIDGGKWRYVTCLGRPNTAPDSTSSEVNEEAEKKGEETAQRKRKEEVKPKKAKKRHEEEE